MRLRSVNAITQAGGLYSDIDASVTSCPMPRCRAGRVSNIVSPMCRAIVTMAYDELAVALYYESGAKFMGERDA